MDIERLKEKLLTLEMMLKDIYTLTYPPEKRNELLLVAITIVQSAIAELEEPDKH